MMKKHVLKQLRKIDIFGYPITLKFRGKDTFRTAVGGIFTLAIVLGLLSYFIIMLKQMVTNEYSQVYNSVKKIGNIAIDKTINFNLTTSNFDIALNFDYVGTVPDVE